MGEWVRLGEGEGGRGKRGRRECVSFLSFFFFLRLYSSSYHPRQEEEAPPDYSADKHEVDRLAVAVLIVSESGEEDAGERDEREEGVQAVHL